MKHLIKISLLSFKNRISALKFGDDLKAAFFVFIAINIAVIIYLSSYAFLKYINSVAVAGPLIANKLVALIFLAAFMMTALSSVIVSFSTLYFAKDIKWLLISPIKTSSVFSFKVLNAAFYASWMVFAVSVPFIAALGAVKNAGVSFYVFGIILLIPFLAGSSFIGSAFSVIIMKFFPAAKVRNLIFVTGAVFFTALLVILRLSQPEKFISSQGFEMLSQYLGYLDAPTAKFLPSWWYAAAILSLIGGHVSKAIFYSLALAAFAGAAFFALRLLAKRFFIDGLNEGQAFSRVKKTKEKFNRRGAVSAVFQKDVKVFFRDSGQWSQILILASIILAYLFSMYKLSFETLKMHNTMCLVNCALVWFIAAASALRLSFPLISLEGESFWFLLSSPVSRLKIFFEKIIFAAVPVVFTSLVLTAAANKMMAISAPVFILTLVASFFVSVLISCLAVSAGTVLPKFNYSNIAQIESSLGGLVFMLLSFFVIIINIVAIMTPVRLFYTGSFSQGVFIKYAGFMLVCNAVMTAVSFYAGYNALKKLEK
jgi:ABC-2 type transport system permease protein